METFLVIMRNSVIILASLAALGGLFAFAVMWLSDNTHEPQ